MKVFIEAFERHELMMIVDNSGAWFQVKSLGQALGLDKKTLRRRFDELEDSAKDFKIIKTLSGHHPCKVTTLEGLMKIALDYRNPKAKHLREFASQLVFNYSKGELEAQFDTEQRSVKIDYTRQEWESFIKAWSEHPIFSTGPHSVSSLIGWVIENGYLKDCLRSNANKPQALGHELVKKANQVFCGIQLIQLDKRGKNGTNRFKLIKNDFKRSEGD